MAIRAALAPLVLLLLTSPVRVQGQENTELPSSKEEVSDALAALQDRFGRDAVRLESFLLQYAIEAGSVLTASVGMPGVETIDHQSYLQVDFDTGIIYALPDVSRAQAPARVWSDIVDPTLRQFQSMEITADGIVLHVRFRHSEDDPRQVLQERRQDSLPSDVVSFRMLCGDIVASVRSEATSGQFLQHAVVLLNGTPTTLQLDADAAQRRPTQLVTPALPLD
jgi:hypothetical protein